MDNFEEDSADKEVEPLDTGTFSDAFEAESPQDLVGGFAFFLSLGALLPTGTLFTALTLYRFSEADLTSIRTFVIAALFGVALTHILIKGHLSTFLHEIKHSIISNLVGNRHRGFRIGEHSGHYEYAYSKQTAHYNAFISLAPYITPLLTFIAIVIALIFFRQDPLSAVALIGLGYGADVLLNVRDISPIQTDISLIRGGYHIGLLYIAAWNLLTFGILLSWVFQGTAGLYLLLEDISACFIYLYIAIFGDPRP